MKSHLHAQVVVLGGGFAGLATSLELAEQPGFRREFNVTLVDRNCYHLYHALLYEVATANFNIQEKDLEYLHGGVCIRLKALGELVTKKQIDFMQATVQGIDIQRHVVHCHGAPDISYDQLVIALGSEPNDFGIPGLRDHSLFLNDIPDALAIRERVRELVVGSKGNSPQAQRIVIGGGGFTGVELAGELLMYFRRLEQKGKVKPGKIELWIVEAGSALLSHLGKNVGKVAQARLKNLGAKFQFKKSIVRVDESNIEFADGKKLGYAVLVWTGGIRASTVIGKSGLPITNRGQLVVEPTLRIVGTTNVWAAGDCISFLDPKTKKPIPQAAPLAVDAGRLLGKNIARSLRFLPLENFKPRHSGFVVPIGGKYAIARTKLLNGAGFAPWLLRRYTDFRYFLSIMRFRNALRVFVRGARVYLKND